MADTIELRKQQPARRPSFEEVGGSGLKQQGGFLVEEYLHELQGLRGIEVYREMGCEPVLGVILFIIELMLGQVEWRIEPFSDAPADQSAKEFVEQCLFQDMSNSWLDTLSEICTVFQYGWAYLEVTYKIRAGEEPGDDPVTKQPLPSSQFNDKKIGWRKWALRGQNTLSKWIIDDAGGIRGMEQFLQWPNFKTVVIPIEKALLFRTRVERNNPEGLSLFRRSYKAWWYMKRFQEIEAIGVERDLAGLPMLRAPDGLDIWNPNDALMAQIKTQAESLVRSIRRGQQEGIVLPGGESEYKRWSLELLTSASRRQFDVDKTIVRYETRMAMSCLAQFIFLGQGKVGSWALSSDQTELFALAIGGCLKRIVEIVNRHAIPPLLKLNKMDASKPPKLAHGDIETPNLVELAQYLTALASAGAVLFPDEPLERYLRRAANFPEPEEGGSGAVPERAPGAATARPQRAVQSMMGELKQKVAKLILQKEYDESKHPRDEHGRWSESAGGDGSNAEIELKNSDEFAIAVRDIDRWKAGSARAIAKMAIMNAEWHQDEPHTKVETIVKHDAQGRAQAIIQTDDLIDAIEVKYLASNQAGLGTELMRSAFERAVALNKNLMLTPVATATQYYSMLGFRSIASVPVVMKISVDEMKQRLKSGLFSSAQALKWANLP